MCSEFKQNSHYYFDVLNKNQHQSKLKWSNIHIQ